jgi:hypothetical protein
VQTDSDLPGIAADDFARRFSMRGGLLMWLLGAGASASAGVPTARDMIWEFKQQHADLSPGGDGITLPEA